MKQELINLLILRPTEDWSELCWKDLFSMRDFRKSKTCLYGSKVIDLFETNPITVTFLLLSRDEKL